MSSTVSSIFSTNNISDEYKFSDDINFTDLLTSTTSKVTPLFTSALNTCYTRALLLLHKHIEDIDTNSSIKSSKNVSSYNVTEDDFDATVFPERVLTPSSTAICQWRHEQFINEKFSRLLISLVSDDMYKILLHWIELELHNEEERGSKNKKKKLDLETKIHELKFMNKPYNIQRLYELSENFKDTLIEQVDWKLIGTKMRSKGGFKYFDEYSLKRMWKHRCQYGLNNQWSENEDEILNQLVEELGTGKWTDIAQHEIFQKNKKSPFMCAQRYMIRMNKSHAKRRFNPNEKEHLLSLYKYRCSVVKDYRFSISYAAYVLGDRCIREITHVWTHLNPDIQKGPFTPEEDTILLDYAKQNASICWSTLASSYLPDRSAVQCRQRYIQLTKPQSTESTKRKRNSPSVKYNQWLQKQSIETQNFLEQFYSKSCMSQLQQSIIEMHSNKIQSLMLKFLKNQNQIRKCLPLRELILKLNTPTVTIDEIYAKFM